MLSPEQSSDSANSMSIAKGADEILYHPANNNKDRLSNCVHHLGLPA